MRSALTIRENFSIQADVIRCCTPAVPGPTACSRVVPFVVAWIIVVMIVGAGVWEVVQADENSDQQFSTKSQRKKERESERERETNRETNMKMVTAKPSQKYSELVSRL